MRMTTHGNPRLCLHVVWWLPVDSEESLWSPDFVAPAWQSHIFLELELKMILILWH